MINQTLFLFFRSVVILNIVVSLYFFNLENYEGAANCCRYFSIDRVGCDSFIDNPFSDNSDTGEFIYVGCNNFF